MNGTRRVGAALALLAGLGFAGEALAQQRGQGGGRADARAKGAQEDLIQPQTEAQIAWFGGEAHLRSFLQASIRD